MLKLTAFTRPLASASATSSADSSLVIASGFSHTTCLPAASSRLACGWWSSFGLVTWTTRTRSSATSSSSELYARGTPRAAARSSARGPDEPSSPTTFTPMRRSASMCTVPMNPLPITAASMSERRGMRLETLLRLQATRSFPARNQSIRLDRSRGGATTGAWTRPESKPMRLQRGRGCLVREHGEEGVATKVGRGTVGTLGIVQRAAEDARLPLARDQQPDLAGLEEPREAHRDAARRQARRTVARAGGLSRRARQPDEPGRSVRHRPRLVEADVSVQAESDDGEVQMASGGVVVSRRRLVVRPVHADRDEPRRWREPVEEAPTQADVAARGIAGRQVRPLVEEDDRRLGERRLAGPVTRNELVIQRHGRVARRQAHAQARFCREALDERVRHDRRPRLGLQHAQGGAVRLAHPVTRPRSRDRRTPRSPRP